MESLVLAIYISLVMIVPAIVGIAAIIVSYKKKSRKDPLGIHTTGCSSLHYRFKTALSKSEVIEILSSCEIDGSDPVRLSLDPHTMTAELRCRNITIKYGVIIKDTANGCTLTFNQYDHYSAYNNTLLGGGVPSLPKVLCNLIGAVQI